MKRLRRIFQKDGKVVIVAMDHGMGLSVNPALDNTGEILKGIVAGGADAVLVTYGIAVKYADILEDIAVIVRADGGGSMLTSGNNCPRLLYTIEDALRIGADAVACMGFPGAPYEHDNMQNLAALVKEGMAWGMPVMAEMLPGGFSPEPPSTPENVKLVARTGCEYGASIIKTTYTGTPEEFRTVIEASYQPVVILGGEASNDLPSLFDVIEKAISVGAAGVAIGRNVWKHENPEAVTRALVDLVHNNKKASDIQGL